MNEHETGILKLKEDGKEGCASVGDLGLEEICLQGFAYLYGLFPHNKKIQGHCFCSCDQASSQQETQNTEL